ncbi:MAG: hypothetical protein IKP55_04600 [Clostridia bacterium]|nr:hypothetical protein [Clostridia bacterium]
MKMTKDKMKGLLAIALFVQAICMFIVSLTQFRRRKGLAFSLLGVSAVCGVLAAVFGKFEYTDTESDEDEDEAAPAEGEDDDLEIDQDMLRADLAHGTDDED